MKKILDRYKNKLFVGDKIIIASAFMGKSYIDKGIIEKISKDDCYIHLNIKLENNTSTVKLIPRKQKDKIFTNILKI